MELIGEEANLLRLLNLPIQPLQNEDEGKFSICSTTKKNNLYDRDSINGYIERLWPCETFLYGEENLKLDYDYMEAFNLL